MGKNEREEQLKEDRRFTDIWRRLTELGDALETKLSDDRMRDAHMMTLGDLILNDEDEAAEILKAALLRMSGEDAEPYCRYCGVQSVCEHCSAEGSE
jgi:hypothetical protein